MDPTDPVNDVKKMAIAEKKNIPGNKIYQLYDTFERNKRKPSWLIFPKLNYTIQPPIRQGSGT
jgi:hypothetical protein